MDQRDSIESVFQNMETNDIVTISTERGRLQTREVFDDTSPLAGSVEPDREFRFGDATKLDILKRGFNGLELKKICDDGSLEAAGDTVLTVVNQTKNEWAGENEDIARKS